MVNKLLPEAPSVNPLDQIRADGNLEFRKRVRENHGIGWEPLILNHDRNIIVPGAIVSQSDIRGNGDDRTVRRKLSIEIPLAANPGSAVRSHTSRRRATAQKDSDDEANCRYFHNNLLPQYARQQGNYQQQNTREG